MAAPITLRDLEAARARTEAQLNTRGLSLRDYDPVVFGDYAPPAVPAELRQSALAQLAAERAPSQRPLPEGVEPIYADNWSNGQGVGENLQRGAAQGWRGLRAAGHAALGGIAEGLGADEFAQNRFADAQHWAQRAAEVAPRVQSYKDVESLQDAVDYGAGVVGNLTGTIPMLAAGAVAARATQGRGSLLQRAAPLMAATVAGMPQEYGDLVQDYKAKTGGAKIDDSTNLRMLGAAGASSALQSVVPSAVGGSLARGAVGAAAQQPARGLLRTVGRAALQDAGEEALFSTAGEALKAKIMDPDQPLDMEHLKEVAVQSAIGGAAMGGVHGVADYGHARAGQLQQGIDKGKQLAGQAAGAVREAVQPAGEAASETMTAVNQKAAEYMASGQALMSQLPGDMAKKRDAVSEMYLNLKNAEDTPAEVKAMLDKKFEQARRNPTNREFAAHVLAAREHMKAVRDMSLGAVQFAQGRVSQAFERKPIDADLDALAEGRPIGDQRAFAEASPEVAAQLYEANQQAAAEKTATWVDNLLKRTTLDEATKAQLSDAARNVQDKATQVWVAGKQKAAQTADKLVSRVDELNNKFKDSATPEDGSKQSADYSGSDAAIREVLLPWLQRKHDYLFSGTVDADAVVNKLGRALRNVVETFKRDQQIDQDAVHTLMDVLGSDAHTVLAGVLSKTGDNAPSQLENFYRRLNGLRADVKGVNSLRNMLSGFASEAHGDARTSEVADIARLVDAYADGSLTRGMGREAALAVEQQLRDGLLEFVGGDEQRFNAVLDLAEQRARARSPKLAPESRAMAEADGADGTDAANNFDALDDDGTDTGGMTEAAPVDEDGEWRPPVEEVEDIRHDFYGGGNKGDGLLDAPEVYRRKHPQYEPPVDRVLAEAREKYPEYRVEFVRYSDNPQLVEQSPQFQKALQGLTEEQRAARIEQLRQSDEGVVVVTYSNAPEAIPQDFIRSVKLDTKRYSRSPARLDFGDFIADAVKITRRMNNERLLPYIPEDNITNNHRRARAFMAGYAELAREFGVAPELRDDLVIHHYGSGAVMTIADAKELKFRPPKRTDAFSAREVRIREVMTEMTPAELEKYAARQEGTRQKLQEHLDTLRSAGFSKDSDAVGAVQEQLKAINRLLGLAKVLMDPETRQERVLNGTGALAVAKDHNTNIVTASAVLGDGQKLQKNVDLDGVKREYSTAPDPWQRSVRPGEIFAQMNKRVLQIEEAREKGRAVEPFSVQRVLSEVLQSSPASMQRSIGARLAKVLDHADLLTPAQRKRLEAVSWGKDAIAVSPHVTSINDLARIVDHQLAKRGQNQARAEATPPENPAQRRNALLQARADALASKESYSSLDTVPKVEAFLKAARASYEELHQRMQEWSRAQRASDDDIPNPLSETQQKAYAVYAELFDDNPAIRADLSTFFMELSDFHQLPATRQQQLLGMAQSLQTGEPSTAAREVAAAEAPKPPSAAEVSGKREALLRRVAQGDETLLDDVAAEPDPKKLQRAVEAVNAALNGEAPSAHQQRFIDTVNDRIAALLQDDPSAQYAMGTRRYSLERAGSAQLRETAIGTRARKWIEAGAPDAAIVADGHDIFKVVGGSWQLKGVVLPGHTWDGHIRRYHPEITARHIGQLDAALENPRAVLVEHSPKTQERVFLFVTDMRDGGGSPILVALKQQKGEALAVHRIASAYGWDDSLKAIQGAIKNGTLVYMRRNEIQRLADLSFGTQFPLPADGMGGFQNRSAVRSTPDSRTGSVVESKTDGDKNRALADLPFGNPFPLPADGMGGFQNRSAVRSTPDSRTGSAPEFKTIVLSDQALRKFGENPRGDWKTAQVEVRIPQHLPEGQVHFSKETVSDGHTAIPREEIRAHIRKVLGDTVQLQFADLAHAGDYLHRDALGESIIRISTSALNPMSTAHHESLHAFFAQLRDMGLGEVQKTLFKASDSVYVRKQLTDFFRGKPEVLEQMKHSAEERVAYMYQLWAAGKLNLKDRPKRIFERIAEAIKRALGIWTNDERALHIMEYFHSGEYARSGIGQPNAVAQSLLQAGRNAKVDDLTRFVQPLAGLGEALLVTGDSRLRDSGIPALAKVADLVKARGIDEREDAGYLPAARQQRAERLNRIADALAQFDLNEEQQGALLTQLQSGVRSDDRTVRAAAVTVHKFLGDMYDYIKPHVDIGYRGRDYFPRMWDVDAISKDLDGFKQMLTKYQEAGHIHDVDEVVASLLGSYGNEFGKVLVRPGAQQFKTRELHFIEGVDAEPWLRKDLMGTLDSYVSQATRRVEFARRFGDDGKKLGALLNEALEEGATEAQIETARRYLEGVGGTLGDTLDPTLRKWMGNAIVYQNIRLLPLAVFSQIIDPMGIVVRGGELKDAFHAYKRALKEIPLGLKGQNATDRATTIARDLGVIENAALVSTIGTLYNQGNATGLARKINDTFFRYNLMETTTTSMRVAAMEAAMRFIQRHAGGENEHSTRYLAELGLKAEDVKVMPDGSIAYRVEHGLTPEQAARVTAAINRWVDGAILRPDSADKPIWMNDPLFMLMAHMKQFTFSFAATTLRRVQHEWQHGNVKPAMALASFVPIMIAGDVAKGLIMGGGQLPTYQEDWELEDWLMHGTERAGLFGVGQYGIDTAQYGVGALAGPTGEQLIKGVKVIGTDAQFEPFLLSSMPANALYREAFR